MARWQPVASHYSECTDEKQKDTQWVPSTSVESLLIMITIIILVHRSEVLANLTEAMRALCNLLTHGGISEILARSPRPGRPIAGANRRLSPVEIDQMVEDYRTGVGSIYDLADIYGVHRNTVAQYLKAKGVKLGGSPMSSDEINRARELHQQGLSGNAIGRAIARDPKTVRTALGVTHTT